MVGTLLLIGWLLLALLGLLLKRVGREAASDWHAPHGLSAVTWLGLVSFAGLAGWLVAGAALAAELRQRWPESQVAWSLGSILVNGALGGAVYLALRRRPLAARRRTMAAALPAASVAGPDLVGRPLGGLGVAAWSLGGLLVALPAVYLTLGLTVALLRWWSPDTVTAHETLQRLAGSESIAVIALLVVSAVVVTPLFEEVLFRGAVQGFCVSVLSGPSGPGRSARWGGILASSLVFAGLHPTWSIPAIFVLSVALGYVYERTGRLLPAVIMHTVFNLMSVVHTLTSRGPGA